MYPNVSSSSGSIYTEPIVETLPEGGEGGASSFLRKGFQCWVIEN